MQANSESSRRPSPPALPSFPLLRASYFVPGANIQEAVMAPSVPPSDDSPPPFTLFALSFGGLDLPVYFPLLLLLPSVCSDSRHAEQPTEQNTKASNSSI
eukprot:84941-Chlamydomonas_euryale.AAC.1